MNGSEQVIAIVVGIMFLAGVGLGIRLARQRSRAETRWMK